MRKHRRVKEIIRTNARGERIKYGFLMVGYLNGIPCLASREVLLLLGIKLTDQKVPDYFYASGHLKVSIKGSDWYKVFTVNRHHLHKLGQELSRNMRIVRCEDEHDVLLTRHWFNGQVTMSITDPENPEPLQLKEVQRKTRPHKVSKLKKCWLAIKRLFTKEEASYDHY